jgi:hypothetical protein
MTVALSDVIGTVILASFTLRLGALLGLPPRTGHLRARADLRRGSGPLRGARRTPSLLLAERWRSHGHARIDEHAFMAEDRLGHDNIAPLPQTAKTELVYPVLQQLIARR